MLPRYIKELGTNLALITSIVRAILWFLIVIDRHRVGVIVDLERRTGGAAPGLLFPQREIRMSPVVTGDDNVRSADFFNMLDVRHDLLTGRRVPVVAVRNGAPVPRAGLGEAQRMIREDQQFMVFALRVVIEEEEDSRILANPADEAKHRLLVLENVLVVRIGATKVDETDLTLHAAQVAFDDVLHDLRHALTLVHVRIDDLVEEVGGAGDTEGEDMPSMTSCTRACQTMPWK